MHLEECFCFGATEASSLYRYDGSLGLEAKLRVEARGYPVALVRVHAGEVDNLESRAVRRLVVRAQAAVQVELQTVIDLFRFSDERFYPSSSMIYRCVWIGDGERLAESEWRSAGTLVQAPHNKHAVERNGGAGGAACRQRLVHIGERHRRMQVAVVAVRFGRERERFAVRAVALEHHSVVDVNKVVVDGGQLDLLRMD